MLPGSSKWNGINNCDKHSLDKENLMLKLKWQTMAEDTVIVPSGNKRESSSISSKSLRTFSLMPHSSSKLSGTGFKHS